MASIKEILSMSVEDRKREYQAVNISKITIDGTEFTDYSAFVFTWEPSYVKSPVRGGDGSISNLNSYTTFVTPHLKIDFSMMSIDSYRAIMNLIYSKNEFVVGCYDVVNNCWTTNKMYFTPEEMPKLWAIARALNGEEWVEVLGVQDFVVEMVGTNADLDIVNVIYYQEMQANESSLVIVGNTEASNKSEIIIGDGIITNAKEGYVFANKWQDENGNIYLQNDAITLNITNESKTLKLYAMWTPSNKHNLVLSYGLGEELALEPSLSGGNQTLTVIPFTSGQTIKQAIQSANIKLIDGTTLTSLPYTTPLEVEFDGVNYDAYTRYGWLTTANIPNNPTYVTDSYVLPDKDLTIYQIFKPAVNLLTYDSNGGTPFSNPISLEYGSSIPKPTPYRSGYTFVEWQYKGAAFTGTMPPTSITLVAKWEIDK